MPTLKQVRKALPEPKPVFKKIVDNQTVFDIKDGTRRMHLRCMPQYDAISEMFWKGNAIDTARCVFDFCKKHIEYNPESKENQTGKTPEWILHDAINGNDNDCKHYGLFCNGIFDSLNRKGYPISCFYRFASDLPGKNFPAHVFSVVKTKKGVLWCDPVLDKLNQYHKYYYILDNKCPKTKNMAYTEIGRVNNIPYQGGEMDIFMMGRAGTGRAKVQKLLKQAAPRQLVNNAVRSAKDVVKKVQPGKLLVVATMAPSRNAFLTLLKVNFGQFARKMFEHGQTPAGKAKLQALWQKVGGKWGNLARNINQGYKHYLNVHRRQMPGNMHLLSGVDDGTIGAPQVLAALAAAAPVIAAFAQLFKQLGIDAQNHKSLEADGVQVLARDHNANDGSYDGTNTRVITRPDGTQVLQVDRFRNQMLEFSNQNDDILTPEQIRNQLNKHTDLVKYADNYVKRDVANKIFEGQSDDELPGATSPAGKAINVITDWGVRVGNFIERNKGLVITGLSITGVVVLANSKIFHSVKRR
jgi:hypothetical protein